MPTPSPLPSRPDVVADEPLPDLIARLGRRDAPPFAVLRRPPEQPGAGPGTVELLLGELASPGRLADLPDECLVAVPFRQLAERGLDVVDDGAPLLALRVAARRRIGAADLLGVLPEGPADFVDTGHDVPDAEYERVVRAVLAEEIAAGEGSNVVVHRSLTGTVSGPPSRVGLGVLGRLLRRERQAYWTFLFHTPGATFVGASPERHVSVAGGVVRMNPISGTLRYADLPPGADRLQATLDFLADAKERDELAMVVDEELKMMADVCEQGGQAFGPRLKEMAHLAHTEYELAGRTGLDVREVLLRTMFAPTVTGSPIRNACRMIARHERRGRGYYGGVLALLGRDDAGAPTLDAPILIRTATIDPDGAVRIPAGATLVRGSRPESELAETRAKAAGVLAAFTGAGRPPSTGGAAETTRLEVAGHPRVRAALAERNTRLADFWLRPQRSPVRADRTPVTVLHAEDDFTAMLAHLLRRLGHPVRPLGWDDAGARAGCRDAELLLVGPGPGDPRDRDDPRIDTLHQVVAARLADRRPVLGVCLGHQVLSLQLGLTIERLPFPDQGVQREIDLFGRPERVGFYNSYAARTDPGAASVPGVALSGRSGRVDALRGPALAGIQFHVESVLTLDGPSILARALGWADTRALRSAITGSGRPGG